MIVVDKLTVAQARSKVGQDKAEIVLHSFPQQTKHRAGDRDADHEKDQDTQSAGTPSVSSKHGANQNQREHTGHPESCLMGVSAQGAPDSRSGGQRRVAVTTKRNCLEQSEESESYEWKKDPIGGKAMRATEKPFDQP